MRLRELAEHPLGLTWVDRRSAAARLARARRTRAASGSWTRSTRRRRWSARPRWASPRACCSSSWPIRATARRSRKRLGVPFHVLPDVLPGLAVQRPQPGPRALEGARAVVAGAARAWSSPSRSAPPPTTPLGRGSGRRARHAPPAAADPAEAVPARAPAGRSRLAVHGSNAAAATARRAQPLAARPSGVRSATRRGSCAACRAAAEVGCDPCSPSTTTPSTAAT